MAQWELSQADIELNDIVLRDIEDVEKSPWDPQAVSKKMDMLGIILDKVKTKMHQNIKDSSFISYVGERRSGKSVLAIAHAFSIDPDLTTENVCFSLDDLKQTIYDKMNTAVVWDEAGVTAYSRDFMKESSKALNKFFQVFGYRRVAVLSTFQHAGYLDNHLRGQLDALLWMQSSIKTFMIDGVRTPLTRKFCKPFTVRKNPFAPPFYKPYTFYQTTSSVNAMEIERIPIPDVPELMKFYNVRNWRSFFDDYEKKKEEFFIELGADEDENEIENQLKEKILKLKEEHKRKLVELQEQSKEKLLRIKHRYQDETEVLRNEMDGLKINGNLYKSAMRKNEAYTRLVSSLVKENRTISEIASSSGIPTTTLNDWISQFQ